MKHFQAEPPPVSTPDKKDLRVWWIPRIPMTPFYVPVQNLDEAKLILETLTRYDSFQYETSVKPDYCNTGGLEMYADHSWSDWYSERGEDFDEWLAAEAEDDP